MLKRIGVYMDSSISSRKSRKKKNPKHKSKINKVEEFEEEDRISSLPTSILHHILSFIPTHYAVHTCVLSKRWRYVWTGIPKLDFNETSLYLDKLYSKVDFLKFVEGVLSYHDPTVVIHKFRLSYMDIIDESDLTSWVSMVLKRKVQKINLDISADSPIEFPSSFFACESLTSIKLVAMHSTLKFPASVCFPNLKLLHFKFVGITCEDGVQQVCVNFPVVEEVMLIECQWYEIKRVDISAPALERMIIDDDEDNDEDDDFVADCEIRIHAKSLVTLDVVSCLTYELSLCNLSSLSDAYIDLGTGSHINDRANKVLQGIYNVKDLRLPYPTLNQLDSVKDLLALSNLKSLTVTRTNFVNGDLLTELFGSLPNIESLVFTDGLDEYSNEGYDWTGAAISQSFLAHLKLFEIVSFYGNETELSLVEFLLTNARALEKITIVSSSNLSANPKEQIEVAKRLLIVPRGSTSSLIDFS